MSRPAIRLVLSDVDGTLLTTDKRLTDATVRAVARLRDADIHFAVTSGRPPRGLAMLVEPLALTTPLAGFNGGLIVDASMATLRELIIDDVLVTPIVDTMRDHGLSVWLYQGTNWFVLDRQGAHVEREARACHFSPDQVTSLTTIRGDIVKVVGVSDEPALIDRARTDVLDVTDGAVSATSSQSYYLDVTHPDANKGRVVDFLERTYGIGAFAIAVIGDMENDLLMFDRAGLRIAVGNASDEVKSRADFVSTSNDDDGFAYAIENFVLAPLGDTPRSR